MSQSDRAIKKFATQLARLDREVKSWRGAQADFTSIENGGNFTFKDGDGNVTAIMGGQDDGSNTIRHVDGPTPPIPSGLSAHVDGPIVQVSWDGSFESNVTHDWHYLEVLAVGPNNEQLTGTINDLSGGETSLAATAQGDWVITARSVSRAGKRSLDGDAGTVAVQLVGLTGAIDAVQESANGKNTIYYSPTEPVAPDGGFNNGDLWFDTSEEGNNTASVWDGAGWVSMEDARLATIIAAQEALESDLQDVQTSVDGKNKITYDPALPPASYVGVVGDTWYRTSGNSMIGFWKWDGSAWVQQALSTTVIPQIDIGAGTFGTMSGSRLDAGSVTADKMLIGGSENMIPMSGVDAGAGVAPHSTYGGRTIELLSNAQAGREYSNAIWMRGQEDGTLGSWNDAISFNSGGLSGQIHAGQAFPVKVGQSFRFDSFLMRRGSEPDGRVFARMSIVWYDFNGNAISRVSGVGQGGVYTPDQQIFVEGTTPNSAAYMRLFIQTDRRGDIVVWRTRLLEQKGAVFIENGAIVAEKLAVGAITAESGIIESLDLGTATVGELDGIRIMGQSIRGEQLSGDAIDGKVITGATYRTSGGNGSWSDAGLFIAQPDGTSMVRFPTDGSPLSLTASDTQIERASIGELDVSYGAVRSGGELTLASGVTAPASPPELTTGWQKLCALPKPSQPSDTNTLGYWANGDQWVRAIDVAEIGVIDRIETYDYETGQVVNSFEIELNPRHGLTVIGDVVYVMGKDYTRPSTEVYVFGYDLNTGARVTRWEYTRGIQARNALGNDGTNLIIGSVYNLELWVHRRNPTTGVQVGSDMRSGRNSWPASGGKDLFGVRISGNDVEVVTSWGGRVYLNSNNALVRKTDTANESGYAGWVLPAHDVSGCAWVSGAPYPVDSNGAVYQGSTSASDYTNELCFTWYDGTHETTASPVAAVDVPARGAVTVSLPVRAGLQKRLYARAQGGTNWARSTVAADVTVATVPVGLQLFAPPTTNSFPNADPATLKSTNNTFEVNGDGSGHWGPLTFNADGTMTSSQIPEWVPVTTFLNGASVQTFGFAPAYRVWPDGKVEWRGVVKFPATTGTLEILTVPTVARPAVDVHASAAASAPSTGMARLDVCDPDAPTTIRVSMSASKEWVSLDGLYYYKD